MSPRAKRASSKHNGDPKIAFIIIALAIVAIIAYMRFFQEKGKVQPHVVTKSVNASAKPVAKPAIKVTKIKTSLPVLRPVIPAAPGTAGKMAFVIDDWGYTTRNCKYLKDIKPVIATAILPNLRHTLDVEKCSSEAGKVVMLHLPMEPYRNNDHYPDNYIISTSMNASLVEKLIEDTLKKMPTIVGVNNHMGSKALESRPLMRTVLRILKKHHLFFIDSMTSPHHSVGAEVAAEVDIPFAHRDVFLDNVNTREAILKQFDELIMKARHNGYAIAIGHDRDLTMKILKEQIPILEAQGFEIVSVKELLKSK